MARWADFEAEQPELAAAVRRRLEAHRHLSLATVRADGSPRISGIEVAIALGDVWLGMMPGSRKGADLRRDPRLALHSGSDDPPRDDPSAWAGDAKLSGRAQEVTDPGRAAEVLAAMGDGGDGGAGAPPPGGVELFRVDLDDAVLIAVGNPPDHLRITRWRPGRPVEHARRA